MCVNFCSRRVKGKKVTIKTPSRGRRQYARPAIRLPPGCTSGKCASISPFGSRPSVSLGTPGCQPTRRMTPVGVAQGVRTTHTHTRGWVSVRCTLLDASMHPRRDLTLSYSINSSILSAMRLWLSICIDSGRIILLYSSSILSTTKL